MRDAALDKFIRLRGVRQNNLKNFDLDLPCNQLVVITGLSGSGKSSLAFETLYAEGQRRYIETFSPYARQFFDRMDKPKVDSIQGIPPAIALEQTNSVKTTRSTVGTMTEITEHMKSVWPRIATLFCRGCGRAVQKDSPSQVWRELFARHKKEEATITFELPLSEKLSLEESLGLVQKQGFQRALVRDGERWKPARLEELLLLDNPEKLASLTIIQDRARVAEENRARLCEAAEQAYHFGKGRLTVFLSSGAVCPFSNRFHCASCNLDYREPTPALFSFNHPVGACPSCKGFGRIITIDYNLAIPDRSLTLDEGAVKPWQSGSGKESQDDLLKFCARRGVPATIPFNELSAKQQEWVINGDPDYGKDSAHEWPNAWYGVRGYFKWLESKAYKMHVRVLLARYRSYVECPDCKGRRFNPESLGFKVERGGARVTLADFYKLPITSALEFVEEARSGRPAKNDPIALCLEEARSRLAYMNEAGLGYLTLDRATRSLSGGETERVNLTACLGARLVNTLFVLDEPSVGLHARDTERLVQILQRLRDAGNTIVVVEHEAAIMRAADQVIDLGPGHGESGGELMFQGPFKQLLKAPSLTGEYLSGRRKIPVPTRRPVDQTTPALALRNANRHNLKNISVQIPLGRFVCITGVSGSGKSTLVREVLAPLLEARLKTAPQSGEASLEDSGDLSFPDLGSASIEGWESLGSIVTVDQSCLGRTPRSNPAVYTGAFEHLRKLMATSPGAQQQGLTESAFSFNSAEGQCQRCKGAGFEKIEMQFLSDVFIRCPDCQGRRYRPHILEIMIQPDPATAPMGIGNLLEATIDDALVFLQKFNSRHAERAARALAALQQVGLGYLRLGQPINTLSGGECQRLKLASYLAEFHAAKARPARGASKPTLFIFDEPTTGLHFEDVRILLEAFQELVQAGHSLIVIEHNLDVIRSADWVLDIGPEGGDAGGEIVICATPEGVAACQESHTGKALRGRAD